MSGESDTQLGLSDEDFLKQGGPPETDSAAAGSDAGANADADADKTGDDNDNTDDTNKDGDAASADDPAGDPAGDADGSGDAGEDDKSGDREDGDPDPNAGDPASAEGDPAAGDKKADDGVSKPSITTDKDKAETDPDPAGSNVVIGFKVPAEFTANGKTVKLRNDQEALTLMQMGANYTKRMQELAPHRKLLMMVQDAKLDESKLNFLIDLERGDPEAIKKLIKDKGIDPLDIDTSTDDNYTPGQHAVTDEQERFRSVVDEIGSTAEGKETLLVVSQWDQTSKNAVWENPEIMTTFHEQRASGVYDLISSEVERRMSLGQIPASTPFIQAYKDVGLEMATEAASQNPNPGSAGDGANGQGGRPAPKVVATRVAEPKAAVANGDKAAAAAPSRATPAAAKPVINPLAQSDDDFLKQFEGRL